MIKRISKKWRFLISLASIIIGVILLLVMTNNKTKNLPIPKDAVIATKKPCALSGSLVKNTISKRKPIAVMVENHVDARPQSGLDKADIIYEGLTEGGITRFMAVYECQDANKIGPVRSARAYFLDWAQELEAVYAHAGGSKESWERIAVEPILDINEFFYAQSFWRESKIGKSREHTLYSKISLLRKIANEKGWNKPIQFKSWLFKDDPKFDELKNRKTQMTIDFSRPPFFITYLYDPTNNVYFRTEGGVANKDTISKKQLSPKTVILQFMRSWKSFSYNNVATTSMQTTGTGEATILMDGKVINATWKKDTIQSRTRFYTIKGKEVQFNRGQFWIEALPIGTPVTIK